MRRLLAPAALVLAACGPLPTPDEEADWASGEAPIINGRRCAEGEEPTAFGVLVDALADAGRFGTQRIHTLICTGTLIAPDVVLLAAHCVDPDVLGEGMARISDLKFYVSGQSDMTALSEGRTTVFPADTVAAKSWVANLLLDMKATVAGPNEFNDVALLFLETALDVQPEVVVAADEAAQVVKGATVAIVGWGQQTITQPWQQPPAGTVGRKVCAGSFINEMNRWEMQIGGGTQTSRKCHGDSGGPTFLTVNTPWTSKRRVVGITSHAYDETDCNKGGVDTRVDAYLGWIDSEMQKACANGTRVWCDVGGIVPAEYYEPPPATNPGTGSGGDAPRRPCGGCSQGELAGLLAALPLALRRRRT